MNWDLIQQLKTWEGYLELVHMGQKINACSIVISLVDGGYHELFREPPTISYSYYVYHRATKYPKRVKIGP